MSKEFDLVDVVKARGDLLLLEVAEEIQQRTAELEKEVDDLLRRAEKGVDVTEEALRARAEVADLRRRSVSVLLACASN